LNVDRPIHFEKLARGRLLFQGDSQFCVPGLHLLEQPRVLKGDDDLVGESLEQLDLAVGEWADLGASDGNHTYRFTRADQRDGQIGAEAEAPGNVAALWVLLPLCLHIRDVDRSLIEDGTANEKATRQG
jgi:hypothetical protein